MGTLPDVDELSVGDALGKVTGLIAVSGRIDTGEFGSVAEDEGGGTGRVGIEVVVSVGVVEVPASVGLVDVPLSAGIAEIVASDGDVDGTVLVGVTEVPAGSNGGADDTISVGIAEIPASVRLADVTVSVGVVEIAESVGVPDVVVSVVDVEIAASTGIGTEAVVSAGVAAAASIGFGFGDTSVSLSDVSESLMASPWATTSRTGAA